MTFKDPLPDPKVTKYRATLALGKAIHDPSRSKYVNKEYDDDICTGSGSCDVIWVKQESKNNYLLMVKCSVEEHLSERFEDGSQHPEIMARLIAELIAPHETHHLNKK